MNDLLVANLNGSESTVSGQAIDAFRSRLRGQLLATADLGYEEARKVYNGIITKRPAIIARCAGVADVIAAMTFAREHQLLTSVRGGGHSVAGTALADRGLVVDLSHMRSVRVDSIARTARSEGGATWGDFDHQTQAFGLATTGGIASTTGIGGLTLGGGIGYLNRKFGLACDNLLSADVVTAEGRLLTASKAEHEDLFWALRGAGGNFGVVTSLEYRLHPVGPVLAGLIAWPLPQAKEVLRMYRNVSLSAPDELRLDVAMATTPGGPAVGLIVCWCGAIEAGEQIIRPLVTFGQPIMNTVAAVPYKTIQTLLESMGYVPGMLQYWKSSFFKELGDPAFDAIIKSFASCPSPLTVIAIEHLGGAIGRVNEHETAFAHRRAQHSFLIFGVWTDSRDTEKNIAWVREAYRAAQPFLEDGAYVNYLGEAEGDARVRAAYGNNYQRLAAVKAKYDPANFFRSNQNIPPVRQSTIGG